MDNKNLLWIAVGIALVLFLFIDKPTLLQAQYCVGDECSNPPPPSVPNTTGQSSPEIPGNGTGTANSPCFSADGLTQVECQKEDYKGGGVFDPAGRLGVAPGKVGDKCEMTSRNSINKPSFWHGLWKTLAITTGIIFVVGTIVLLWPAIAAGLGISTVAGAGAIMTSVGLKLLVGGIIGTMVFSAAASHTAIVNDYNVNDMTRAICTIQCQTGVCLANDYDKVHSKDTKGTCVDSKSEKDKLFQSMGFGSGSEVSIHPDGSCCMFLDINNDGKYDEKDGDKQTCTDTQGQLVMKQNCPITTVAELNTACQNVNSLEQMLKLHGCNTDQEAKGYPDSLCTPLPSDCETKRPLIGSGALSIGTTSPVVKQYFGVCVARNDPGLDTSILAKLARLFHVTKDQVYWALIALAIAVTGVVFFIGYEKFKNGKVNDLTKDMFKSPFKKGGR